MVKGVRSLPNEELVEQLTMKACVAGALTITEGVLSGRKMQSASWGEIERVVPATLSELHEVTSLQREVLRRMQRRPTPGRANSSSSTVGSSG